MSLGIELRAMQTSRQLVETALTPKNKPPNLLVKAIGVPVGWVIYAGNRVVYSAQEILNDNISFIQNLQDHKNND